MFSVILTKFCLNKQFVRYYFITQVSCKNKKRDHWHVLANKKGATTKALEHFDDFYKSIFRLKWPSVRLGLLTPQKYVALVNNFGDPEKSASTLENLGAMDLNTVFQVWEKNIKDEKDFEKRQGDLDKIFEMEKMLDRKSKDEEQNDLNILYPDGTGDKLKGMIFSKDDVKEKAEEDADHHGNVSLYEADRLIDPDLGIDSGSLLEFVPATKLKGMDDFITESEYYSYYKSASDVPLTTVKQYKLNYPEHLKVFSFLRGVFENYPTPRKSSTGVYNYYLMDGASILPVLALDVKPGDTVLDMCCAPGGKSLAILQTMAPKLLVCNDVSASRVKRIHGVLEQYLYDYNSNWKGMLSVQQMDGAAIDDVNVFDKIIVDAPCTNDRHSLQEDDNNIFKQGRIKERLRIPEVQAGLLTNALHLVKPGGTVVYSTCSLSPVQNDGVVGMALRRLWEERRMEFTVVDMTPALRCTSEMFNFGKNIGLKYGSLVVPFLPSNFGPMYFCKIVKNL